MISTRLFPLVSLLFTAAIFGFFYAWDLLHHVGA
jgi:hypothetical protein